MLFKEIIAVYNENRMKPTTTKCREKEGTTETEERKLDHNMCVAY
jgi:hypothetical protein